MVSADPSSVDIVETPLAGEASYRARWGVVAALQHAIVQRLASRLGMRIYGIFSRRIEPPTGSEPDVPGFTSRVYSASDEVALLSAAANPKLGITNSFVRQALAKGDACDAVLRDGKIVAFSWSAFTPTHDHDGVYVRFDNAYRYTYFAYTLPEFRGRHLPRLFSQYRDRMCVEHGRTNCLSYIAIDNHASMRSFIACGNRRIGFAGYWLFGPVFIAFRTAGVRRSGLRFYKP